MGKSVYLIAFVITLVIFVGVFSFVRANEEAQINRLYFETTQLYEEMQYNKILTNYLSQQRGGTLDQNACLVYERQVLRQLTKIYELFNRLEQLDSSTFAVSKETVRRQYLLTSMSLWIDLKTAGKSCPFNIKPVLFFLPSTPDCVICTTMINQLETLKQQCPNVRVFAFPTEDSDFEFTSLLRAEYAVNTVPAIVIDQNVIVSIVDTQELKQQLYCQ